MFHVLSILLILTLAGVCFHQLVSMLMLRRRPVKPRHRTAHSSRHQHARRQAREAGLVTDELPPEKPIQIHMASDDGLGPDLETGEHPAVVRKPPPIYGNTRTSMRINPDFVYAKQVAPSPVTPTYDEAMTEIQHTVGYRPPSYLSESGASEIVASQARDVDAALENIHPLERERMRILAADALEGRS
ncbi:hypothetical protein LTS15_005029 [Exophiala xenobiotica]|nr:hypothetical protein LTS15_005029 [Exophiala xenobiotica]